MIQRTFWAATAAFLLLCGATTARADVVKTRDGQWWPASIQEDMKGAKAPSDDVLKKAARTDADLQYDTVKIGGKSFSAGEVVEVYGSECFENEAYRNADVQAQTQAWEEAATNFALAAEELKGASKQISMWNRVLCLAQTNDASKTFDASQELLEAFPKTWYYARVQDMRARVLLNAGKQADAKAALEMVVAAPAMNARDYFEAKIAMTQFFSLAPAGKDEAKLDAARREFQMIVNEIRGRSGAAKEADIQMLKANVAMGRCFVYMGGFDGALPLLNKVVADPASLEDKALLAQAYTGLGDALYGKLNAELDKSEVKKDQLPRLNEQLTQAALHYLRVTKFYVESAGDDLFPATVGLARVWATQFTINGETDCPMAKRATQYFVAAHKMLGRGEARRLLTREIKLFLAKRESACQVPEGAADAEEKPSVEDK